MSEGLRASGIDLTTLARPKAIEYRPIALILLFFLSRNTTAPNRAMMILDTTTNVLVRSHTPDDVNRVIDDSKPTAIISMPRRYSIRKYRPTVRMDMHISEII